MYNAYVIYIKRAQTKQGEAGKCTKATKCDSECTKLHSNAVDEHLG